MRIFLAGATGAIGRHLVPQLITAGHRVTATTRSESKVPLLWNLGAEPVVVDGLDAAAIGDAVARAEPEVVIHQMTGLTGVTNLKHFDREFAETNRLRTEGLDHLLAAARATGRAPDHRAELHRLAEHPRGERGQDRGGSARPEPAARAARVDGGDPPRRAHRGQLAAGRCRAALRHVLRQRRGRSSCSTPIAKRQLPIVGDGGAIWSWIHIEDAAAATVAAVERGSGIYNIVDDDPTPVREMVPALAELLGAKPPRHVPVWLARMLAGEVGVSMLTQIRGSSNAKARRELGWAPRWTSWRDGVRQELETAVAAG